MKKISFWAVVIAAFILSAIAALAADDQPLSAAVGFTTDSFTLFWKIGVPSGLITGGLSLLGIWWTNRNTQKNNREKITAEADNLSRQLSQRQHEFEIQTKMQIESLHSDEKKKVCWDFLACVSPSTFRTKQFNPEKMNEYIQPLYLYCKDNYFSYFENISNFIEIQKIQSVYNEYEHICQQENTINEKIEKYEHMMKAKQTVKNLPFKYTACKKGLARLSSSGKKVDKIIELYTKNYEQAREAAKKMIWNEPIDKAKPLKFVTFDDEDHI